MGRGRGVVRSLIALICSALLVAAVLSAVEQPAAATPPGPGVPVLPTGAPRVPPAPTDATTATDTSSAQAIAARFHHPVEITDLEDANATTYANPDGTFTTRNSTTPVRVRQRGGWVPVDLTLRNEADGTVRPVASPVAVSVGGFGSTTIATLDTGDGMISYTWPTPLPAPALSGPVATYADLKPGVDLVVTVGATGVETSFVFRSRHAVAAYGSLSLSITTVALTASSAASGSISYSDPSGVVVAHTPVPKAWDSRLGGGVAGPGNGPVAPATPAASHLMRRATAATSSLGIASSSTSAGGSRLSEQLQVPSSLAADPAVVYPVVVDPAVNCTTCGAEHHGYVENDGDTEIDSSFDGGTVHVGTFDSGTTKTRGLYEFDQGLTHGATISSATLELGNVYSWSCTTRPVSVYKATPFTSGVTWSTLTAATGANYVTRWFARGYSSSCASAEEDFNVTGIVQDTANDATTFYYFMLTAYDRTNLVSYESDNLAWKKFQGSAVLAVTYNRAPSTPTSVGFKSAVPTKPSCVRGTSRPAIDATQASSWQAHVSDPDGNTVEAQFQWWDLATPATVHTATSGYVASGGTASVAFAGSTTTFVDGHNYGFTVRAYDGGLYSGWASGAATTTSCEFTVSDPPPNNPTVLTFASPSAACSPTPSMRNDGTIEFSASISDPDNGYGKTVAAVFKLSTSSGQLWSWTSPYGSNRTVTSAPVPLADMPPDQTAFTWSVSATNGQKSSGSTPTCSGFIDDSQPAAPQITAAHFGNPAAPAGQVGDNDTITISSPDAVKYAWVEVLAGVAPTSVVAGACGTVSAADPPVHTICASAGGAWNQFTVHAAHEEFKIVAQSFNSAGTPSVNTGESTFDVTANTPSHEWFTDGLDTPSGPPLDANGFQAIPDAATAASPIEVTPTGTSWVTTKYSGEDTDPQAPTGGPTYYGTALELSSTGTGSAASTGGPPLDVELDKSFTASIWVRPTVASSSTRTDVAMAQDGAVNSTFFLGQYNGYWTFCMPHTQTYSSSFDGDCAYVGQGANYVNQWTLLTAVWDTTEVNSMGTVVPQMRLYVGDTAANPPAAASVDHTATGGGTGPVTLGAMTNGAEYGGLWNGDLLNPIVYSGIADEEQISALYHCGLPADSSHAVCW